MKNTASLHELRYNSILSFIFLFTSFTLISQDCPIGGCGDHSVTNITSELPNCNGIATIDVGGSIDNNSDCDDGGNCFEFIIMNDVVGVEALTFEIGKGAGCNGEVDNFYTLIDGTCEDLSSTGSQNFFTIEFTASNSITIYLCDGSSGQVSLCGLCAELTCSLEVTCPNETDLGEFNCDNLPPSIPQNSMSLTEDYGVTINDSCGDILIESMDNEVLSNCDGGMITRTINVIDDTGDGNGGLPNGEFDQGESSTICTFNFSFQAATQQSCNDGDPCTINDVETVCGTEICSSCVGVPIAACTNFDSPTACNDGDPCTENDMETLDSCTGEVCVPCAGDPKAACSITDAPTACDDGDPCTENDVETLDSCTGGVCVPCAGDPIAACSFPDAPTACDDGDPCTENDVETLDTCTGGVCMPCAGIPIAACALTDQPISCDDGDPCTVNDIETLDSCTGMVCIPCAGTPIDCSSGSTSIRSCDDGDPCTDNEQEVILDCDGSICVPCMGTIPTDESCLDDNCLTLDFYNTEICACDHIADPSLPFLCDDCECPEDLVQICHIPPGNTNNAITQEIACNDLQNHINNHPNDYCGPCNSCNMTCEDNDCSTEDILNEDDCTCTNVLINIEIECPADISVESISDVKPCIGCPDTDPICQPLPGGLKQYCFVFETEMEAASFAAIAPNTATFGTGNNSNFSTLVMYIGGTSVCFQSEEMANCNIDGYEAAFNCCEGPTIITNPCDLELTFEYSDSINSTEDCDAYEKYTITYTALNSNGEAVASCVQEFTVLDQPIASCTSQTSRSCDDGDECTINDVEFIDDCTGNICIPCAGTLVMPSSCQDDGLLCNGTEVYDPSTCTCMIMGAPLICTSAGISDPCSCVNGLDCGGIQYAASYVQILGSLGSSWRLVQSDGTISTNGIYTDCNVLANTDGTVNAINGTVDDFDNDMDGVIDEADERIFFTYTFFVISGSAYSLVFEEETAFTVISFQDSACTCDDPFDCGDLSFACNDQIQVSMGQNCLAFVSLDMITEGGLACDEELYSLDIPGSFEDIDFPGLYIIDTPGKYTGTVTGPSGTTCSTSILVEDKVNAIISCPELSNLRCGQSYLPGDPILDLSCEDFNGDSRVGPSSDPSNPNILEITFDFSGLDSDNLVDDIQLNLDVNVAQVQDVRVMLVTPDNPSTLVNEADTITVLDLVSGNTCTNSDFNLELDDDHFLTHNQLIALGCDLGNNHAYCGAYTPFTPFSTLDGAYADGDWKLLFVNFSSTAELSINNAEMCLVFSDGIVTWPYGEEEDITPIGNNCYEINFENKNCGPYIACYEDDITECLEGSTILGDGGSSTLVSRTWTVVSQSSNLESTCTQDILLTRWIISPEEDSEIICPPDYDGTEHAPFLCSQFFTTGPDGLPQLDQSMFTSDGLPAPSITGFPESPFGDLDLCAGYQATFSDTKLDICGDFSFKVLREWTILDWCTGDLLEKTQIIKVLDIEAPVVVAPDDGFQAYSENDDCVAIWTIEPPVTVFDCGFVLNPNSYNFNVGYLVADTNGNPPPNGEYLIDSNVLDTDNDGFPDEIRNLPLGRTWIRYEITDECGNVGFAFTEIDIIDHSAPNAVCIEHIVVALDENGEAIVEASSFDAESYDNCGIDSICARRIDIIGSTFTPTVEFNCGDMGSQDVGIEVLVKDNSGNTSVCVVSVDVQFPSAIDMVSLPEDITIGCNDMIPTGASFEDDFVFEDDMNLVECPINVTCDDPEFTIDLDDCGDGKLVCNCTVTGTGIDETYSIMITIENDNPFTPDLVDWSPLDNYTNQVLESCPAELNLDPGESELGQPIIPNSDCSLLAVSYDDQIFENVDGACLKILRTWTVIEWCTYDPNAEDPDGYASYVQVIKINDVELPVFDETNTGGNIESETVDGCIINTSTLDTDGILVLSEEEGTDSCSDLSDMPILVTYEIDYNQDDTVDHKGEGRNANGMHPYGCHTICWTIEDFCGNFMSYCHPVCINDNRPPNLHCVSSAVSVIVDENSSCVEIWANDFDFGSTDNVTGTCNENELSFTLTDPHSGESGNSLTFCCDDILNGVTNVIPLQMWVADEFGNSDYCEVLLILQDNDTDACMDNNGGSSRVSGNVYTEEDIMVEGAMVSIENPTLWFNQMMTLEDGEYYFDHVPISSEYTIKAEKEDNYLNGVSTLDLVLIQKHILGVESLSSAYKVIAADADGSNSISAIDLIVLRKLILGVDPQFPNDDMPWRFVDVDQQFSDLQNPFPYNEQIELNNLDQTTNNNDFIAVKIGDVNGNAVVNNLHTNDIEKRSSNTLNFEIQNKSFKANEIVNLPITSTNFNNIIGYQFTMWISPQYAELLAIEEAGLMMNDEHFGYQDLENGHITTSWNHPKGVSLNASDALFTINLKIKKDCSSADLFSINSKLTVAEAYDANLNVSDIHFVIEGQSDKVYGYKLHQNTPNPFGFETSIAFELPSDEFVSLNIYNVNGDLLRTFSGNYAKGLNTILVNTNDLSGNRILYYKLDTGEYSAVRKMIVIK